MKFSVSLVFTKSEGYVRLSERCFTCLNNRNLKIIHIETRWSEKEKHNKSMSWKQSYAEKLCDRLTPTYPHLLKKYFLGFHFSQDRYISSNSMIYVCRNPLKKHKFSLCKSLQVLYKEVFSKFTN